MTKPWYIDVITAIVVVIWMAWTFATIQQYGPSFPLIGGAVVIAVVGVLMIYGQRLRFIRIGDRVQLGFRTPEDYETKVTEEEREKWR